ncbi:MAG: serine hydrolase domain-containing protein [Gemmatimonadales bacterium]
MSDFDAQGAIIAPRTEVLRSVSRAQRLTWSPAVFVVAALSTFVFATPSPLIGQTRFPSDAAIRDMVQPLLPARGTGGAVIGLLEADGTRRVVTVGRVPYDGRTVFEIASITKVFTGVLLAEMVERGEVSLEQPVAALLPDSMRVPSRAGQQITLRDLATHTSGLPRGSRFRPANPGNPWGSFTLDKLYEQVTTHELRRDIGTGYEYSNIGVGLLGHALALRAATSYEALVTARILEPLGMTSTTITLDSVALSRLAPGHDKDGHVVPNWTAPAIAGAGALRSTADDMLTFIASNLSPPEGSLGRALRRAQETYFTVDASQRIGLTWQIGELVDHTVFHHSGGSGGYRSFIVIDTARGVGLITLTNTRANLEFVAGYLLDQRFPLTSIPAAVAFAVLTLTLSALLVVGVAVAWRRTNAGGTWRITVVILVGTAVWTLGTLLASLHVITPATAPSGIAVIIVAASAMAVGIGLSGVGRKVAAGLPLAALIGVQSYRLVLELIMHRTYHYGAFPSALTRQGYTLDVVVGASALVVALFVAAGRAEDRWLRAWNWLGLGLLLNIVIMSWLNSWVAGSVFIWLPAVMLPFGVVGHVVVFHRLARAHSTVRRSA